MNKEDVALDFPVVQWLRIRSAHAAEQVQFAVWEDSTCLEANKSMRHNY